MNYRDNIREQSQGDKHIDTQNFNAMVGKVNSESIMPFAREDVESVRMVGSHKEIVLRQKPLLKFQANAPAQTLSATANINFGVPSPDFYNADVPYKHESGTHLLTFNVDGWYEVQWDIECSLTLTSPIAADIYESIIFQTTTNGDTDVGLSKTLTWNYPGPHALAHDHSGAVASDLGTTSHISSGTLNRHATLSMLINPKTHLTSNELYLRAIFTKVAHNISVTADTFWKILKVG